MRPLPIRVALLLAVPLALCAATLAQSDADIKTLDKARALYLTGPIPNSVACDAAVDWDGFLKSLDSTQQTDQIKARLQKFKDIKIHVVSRDAEHTDVTFTGADPAVAGIATLTDGLSQQLRGFFQIYRSEAFGQFLGKHGDPFALTSTADGYQAVFSSGASKASVAINRALLVTSFSFISPQINATVSPHFEAGNDGLQRLRHAEETVTMGATKMAIDFGWDYQKIDGYDIPQHLHMALPGSFAFDYALSNCRVNADAAPAVTPSAN